MVDANTYCFCFSAGVWDMGFVSKREDIADEIRSLAQSCVVISRGLRSLNDVRGNCDEGLLFDLVDWGAQI
jgi:hypothetical protein